MDVTPVRLIAGVWNPEHRNTLIPGMPETRVNDLEVHWRSIDNAHQGAQVETQRNNLTCRVLIRKESPKLGDKRYTTIHN